MKNELKNHINIFNFEFQELQKNAIKLKISTVDFKCFYSFLSEEEIIEAKIYYQQIRKKQPFVNFYLGLIHEYGLTEKIDTTMALMYYLEGANRYDPYCAYRLYFIYRDEPSKFKLSENNFLELKYLILSALFSSNFDNRFNKRIFDPQNSLKIILKNNLLDENTFSTFFKIFQNENYFDAYIFEQVFEIFFKENDNKYNIDVLVNFVSKYQTAQGLFLLGKIYFYGCSNIEYDDKLAYSYLSQSALTGFPLALNLFVENMFDLQYYEDFISTVAKYSEFYAHNSLRYHANEIAKNGINLTAELDKALNLYKKAYFLGDFWSLFEYCELLDKKNLTNAKIYYEKAVKIYENRLNIGNVLMDSSKIILLYKCYSKGIGCKKDLTFIDKILKEFLEDNIDNLNNVRFVRGLCYYAKVLTKLDDIKANKYFELFFKNVTEILSSDTENNKNFMLLSMKAKCYEYGRGCEKDLENALLYYQTSLKCKKYFFYFEHKHKVKIEAAVDRINLNSNQIVQNKNVDNFLCVICLCELREILYEDCKHLVICSKCMNKMSNKNECPVCRTESSTVKIFY